MNEFTRHSIDRAVRTIAANRFDVFHIKSLLIDLREEAPSGSVVREVGDFLAHPNRDRGPNHANVGRMIEEFRGRWLGECDLHIRPTADSAQILNDLVRALAAAGINEDLRRAVLAARRDVIICILALLQGAEFVGLSARAKAYLHNDGFEKLGLGIYFNVDDLHIPDFPRKGIKINFTIISTEIPVPAVVRKGGNPDSPDEIPCFACERDASGELSMTLV